MKDKIEKTVIISVSAGIAVAALLEKGVDNLTLIELFSQFFIVVVSVATLISMPVFAEHIVRKCLGEADDLGQHLKKT